MKAKSNSNILQLLCLATLVMSLLSCKKEMPPKYSGEDFLYFRNTNASNPDASNIHGVYNAKKSFSFFISIYQMDTLQFNVVDNFTLAIRTDGRLSDKNRPILLELEGNGKEFAVLPHPDSMYIRANELEYLLNLKLVRPPLSDTGTKTLTLILKNNDQFKPDNHTWNKVTYIFGNLLEEPLYYYEHENYFGEFSSAKMITIQEAVDRKGAAYWQTNPDMIALNNFIDLRGGKHLNFDPFSIIDLYNFIDDVQLQLWNMPTGPMRTAYNNIKAEMASLSKDLLIEKKNAGHPVLDETGKEISFP